MFFSIKHKLPRICHESSKIISHAMLVKSPPLLFTLIFCLTRNVFAVRRSQRQSRKSYEIGCIAEGSASLVLLYSHTPPAAPPRQGQGIVWLVSLWYVYSLVYYTFKFIYEAPLSISSPCIKDIALGRYQHEEWDATFPVMGEHTV